MRWNVVRSVYKEFTEAEAPADSVVADLDAILDGKLTPFAPFDKIQKYSERLGTTLSASPTGHVFVNGKHFKLDDVTCSEITYFSVNPDLSLYRTSSSICRWK